VSAEAPDRFWKKKAPAKTYRKPRAVQPRPETSLSEVVPLSSDCETRAQPYRAALASFSSKAGAYWREIGRKKKLRSKRKAKRLAIRQTDYVLVHPPAYTGPSRPKCLDAGKPKTRRPKSTLPLVSDFRAAARRIYGFTPRPSNEREYKRIYAREALAVGLTAHQVVGVYALETGGIGPYFRQSGIFPVNQKCQKISPRGRPASTALSYAQLLAANTNVMAKEHGERFARRLESQAHSATPERAHDLRQKAKVLRRMVRDIKAGIRKYSRRNNWREYVAFGKTSKGRAVHALLLDPDIGPLLQVHKLKKIADVAASRGFHNVSAAQLELMNLVGYGRGLEMMTRVGRDVPTSNFFTRGGYQRNPVAKNRTAKGLLDKIAERIKVQMGKCGSKEFLAAFRSISG
ncbi:MAG: hypothetical protein ACR2O4_03400, partial [Hyphomicrobiaceae bacterium]